MLWYVLAHLRIQKHKLKINERQKRRLYHCYNNRICFGNYRQDRESSIKLRYGALLYQFDRRKHRPWAVLYQLQARKSHRTVKAKIRTHCAKKTSTAKPLYIIKAERFVYHQPNGLYIINSEGIAYHHGEAVYRIAARVAACGDLANQVGGQFEPNKRKKNEKRVA